MGVGRKVVSVSQYSAYLNTSETIQLCLKPQKYSFHPFNGKILTFPSRFGFIEWGQGGSDDEISVK